MRMLTRSTVLPLLLTLTALASGCSSAEDVELARAEIPRFRQQLAARQFEHIYAAAGDDLKNGTTQADWVALLAAVDRKLGAVRNSHEAGWNVSVQTSGRLVSLGAQTQFERGNGVETFVYRVSNGKAVLAGYHINSNALITD